MSLFDDASLVLTPNGYKASKLYSIKPTSGLGDMVVTRNTTARRVNSAGLIESVAINVPRLDYTGGGCPRILVEPLRTNLVLRSEQFDNAYWFKSNITITANTAATLAPDGTTTADKVVATSVGFDLRTLSTIPITNGATYTWSAYVKNAGFRYVRMTAWTSDDPQTTFDLNSIAVTSQVGPAHTSKIEDVGNGWRRVIITRTATAATAWLKITPSNSPNSNGTVNGVDGVYIWGAQLEAGSNATSYIPTTTATVTRNADVISQTGISSLIGQTEGTVFVDAQITNFADAAQSFITISDGTINNRVELRKSSTSQIILEGAASTGTFPGFTLSSVAVGRYKIAVAYQSGNSYLYINGTQVGSTSANAFAFTSLTNIVVGANATGSTRFLNDRINLATVFPTRLTNAQLATLTTL